MNQHRSAYVGESARLGPDTAHSQKHLIWLLSAAPCPGQYLFGAALQLPALVWPTEANHHSLSARRNELLDPVGAPLGTAGAYALATGHSLIGSTVVAFDELTHFPVGLGFIIVDIQGGVDTAVQLFSVGAGLLGKFLDPIPAFGEYLSLSRVGKPTVPDAQHP